MPTPRDALRVLFDYCREQNWAGHDPDAEQPLLNRGLTPCAWRPRRSSSAPLDALSLRVPKTQNGLAFNLRTPALKTGIVDTFADYQAGLASHRVPSPGGTNHGAL
jgi:hypothetical protein